MERGLQYTRVTNTISSQTQVYAGIPLPSEKETPERIVKTFA